MMSGINISDLGYPSGKFVSFGDNQRIFGGYARGRDSRER